MENATTTQELHEEYKHCQSRNRQDAILAELARRKDRGDCVIVQSPFQADMTRTVKTILSCLSQGGEPQA